jgi:hypothetical protein
MDVWRVATVFVSWARVETVGAVGALMLRSVSFGYSPKLKDGIEGVTGGVEVDGRGLEPKNGGRRIVTVVGSALPPLFSPLQAGWGVLN